MKVMYKDTLFMLLGWIPIRVALKPQKGGMIWNAQCEKLQQGQVAAHDASF